MVHGETNRIRGQAAARLLLGVGLWACAGAAAADTPVAADDPACPSQDFTRFLQRFADPADDRVRLRYTSDPLEYEVPMHTVRGGTITIGERGFDASLTDYTDILARAVAVHGPLRANDVPTSPIILKKVVLLAEK